MEILQVKVPFDQAEMRALVRIADGECRHPHEQLRFLLIEEARRRGLLPKDEATASLATPTGRLHAASAAR